MSNFLRLKLRVKGYAHENKPWIQKVSWGSSLCETQTYVVPYVLLQFFVAAVIGLDTNGDRNHENECRDQTREENLRVCVYVCW